MQKLARLRQLLSDHPALRAGGCVIAGLLLTAILFFMIRNLEDQHLVSDFQRRAANRVTAVKAELEQTAHSAEVLNKLFSTVNNGSYEQFQTIATQLLERNPYIRNFAFHKIVSTAERPAFEMAMRTIHPDFRITELTDGRLVPAASRDRYRVVTYVVPMQGNERALGLDAATRPQQRDAQMRACRTGMVSATPSYQLVQQSDSQRGFLLLMPVYHHGRAGCDAVLGYTVATLDGSKLVKSALAARGLLHLEGFEVAVYARAAAGDNGLVFLDPSRALSMVNPYNYLQRLLYKWSGRYSAEFEIAGQHWQVAVSRQLLFSDHRGSLSTLIAGMLISMLGGAYLYATGMRSQHIHRLAAERAVELARMQKLLSTNRQLDRERAYLKTLFEQAPGFIAILNGSEHVFEIANTAYYQLVGHRELIGMPVRAALPELEGQGFFELLDQVFATAQPFVGRALPITVQREPGGASETRYVDFVYQPIMDADGKITAIFVQGNDVSQEKISEHRLQHLATHDALTNLPNYAYVHDRLQQAIAQVDRDGQALAVMILDLDRFKFINESMGHRSGDEILKIIAMRLQAAAPHAHTVARLDGDKFALVGPAAGMIHAAQRIKEAVAQPLTVHGHEFVLSCSLGIATYPGSDGNAGELLQNADIAMSRAKARGGNNFQFHTADMNHWVRDRLKLTSALRNALARSEFVLHYQPQIDLVTGAIVGMEALLRWRHPELGMVPPNQFIALAEETGLIVPIGAWVLRTACAQAKAWQDAGYGKIRVAVNLSVQQFSQQDIVAVIESILHETMLDPHCLDIELTENMVMLDVNHAVDVLEQIKKLGVLLSIDDFGTGYSSLSYLKRFPIDMLKIDRSFIRDIPADANDAAISDAIISMAHSLGMRVIAEGVETEEQCQFLAQNMCDEIQGFLFSQALAPDRMEQLLRQATCLPAHLLRMHKPTRTLLLVDDEPAILATLKRLLRKHDYRILTAACGEEGLRLLAENSIDVIVSDQRMPGMTGVEFLRQVKTLHPDTVRIVLSGFSDLQSITDAVNEGAIYKFLTKPWDNDQLREHIDEAFRHKEMANDNRRLNMEVRAANRDRAAANRQLGYERARQNLYVSNRGAGDNPHESKK